MMAGGISGAGKRMGMHCCTAAETVRGGPISDSRVTVRLTREDSLRSKSMVSILARLSKVVTKRLRRNEAMDVSKLKGFFPAVDDRKMRGPRRYATSGI